MRLEHSKKKLQSTNKIPNLMSKRVPVGIVLTIIDIVPGTYTNKFGVECSNDSLTVQKEDGTKYMLLIKDYTEMKADAGTHYHSETGNDTIQMPCTITIVASEDRYLNGEATPRYSTYAYNRGQEYVDNNRSMNYLDLVASGLTTPCHFDPLQNYTVDFK